MPINHNSKQDLQIIELKTDVNWIKNEVASIKTSISRLETNCIPTINASLARADTNQKVLMAFMFAIVAALIGLFFK